MTQHTKTPYHHDNNNIFAGRELIAVLPIGIGTDTNAAFIVRACNCHEEFVEACKWACVVLSENLDRKEDAISVLKAILKKAKGEL